MLSKVRRHFYAKKGQRCIVLIALCCPLYFTSVNAQIIGADLAADVSIGGDSSQKKAKSSLFSLSSTTFSLSDELQYKPGKNLDQNNYSAKAEFWSQGAWGFSGNIQQNAFNLFGLPKDSDLKRIDVNRKFIKSQNSDSYLAFGLGWQSLNIDGGIESDGLNLSLLGKYAINNNFKLYGNGSLFQGLDNEVQDDVAGFQLEAGLNYELSLRLSFSAGFKISDLESQLSSQQSSSFSSSFLIGTSLSF